MGNDNTRLDASESLFFKRQLEAIDKTVYETIYPELKARSLIPTVEGVPDTAPIYTWRMFNKVGSAKIVANMSDDLPRSDATGDESSQFIKTLGASYGWDVIEIKEANRVGTPLDSMKAGAARYAIENKIDQILATGDTYDGTNYWARGLLNQANAGSYTPVTKSGGGLTWAAGTSDEIAADIFGITAKIVSNLKDSGGPQFHRFRVLIPVEQYNLIAQKRMGDGSDKTVLQFVMGNSPFVESITPWFRCDGAGANGLDRMAAYPMNPMVLGALVPMEYTTLAPEQRNLTMVTNAMARCGGVISRYPVALCYADGI